MNFYIFISICLLTSTPDQLNTAGQASVIVGAVEGAVIGEIEGLPPRPNQLPIGLETLIRETEDRSWRMMPYTRFSP